MPTPRSLGAALVLTWCAAFVGAWVSASLIRDHAKPLAPGYRSRVGGAIGTRLMFVIGVGLLFFLAINVTDRRISSEVRSTAQNPGAGLSLLLYSEQVPAAAHRNFVVGLKSFVTALPRVGAYRTSRAQQRAFLRTPGLRTMQTALMELDGALLRGRPSRPRCLRAAPVGGHASRRPDIAFAVCE